MLFISEEQNVFVMTGVCMSVHLEFRSIYHESKCCIIIILSEMQYRLKKYSEFDVGSIELRKLAFPCKYN